MATSMQTLIDRTNAAVLARMGEAVLLDGVTVQADFAEPGDTGDAGGVGFEVSAPQIVLQTSAVPVQPRGLPVVARGKTYTVAERMGDAYGLTTLKLEAVL